MQNNKHQVIVLFINLKLDMYEKSIKENRCFILSPCGSPCSIHSVFSHHLLCGAAATSQHVRHVPLWAAGHPCVRGQRWVTQTRSFSSGVTLTSTEWDNTHAIHLPLYIMIWQASSRVLISILPGLVPVRLSGHIADILSVLSAASTSLLSALYSILRSIVTVALLYGFCYGALKVRAKPTTMQWKFLDIIQL